MAKLKSKLVSIYAPAEQRKLIIKKLQEMAVMDIDSAAEEEETAALPDGYFRNDTSAKSEAYLRSVELCEKALAVLQARSPEKKGLMGMFSGPRTVRQDEFYLKKDTVKSALTAAGDVLELDRDIAEQKAEIVRLNTGREQLLPWQALDVPLSFSGTAKTKAFIGTVTGVYTLEGLYEKAAALDAELSLYAEIVGTGRDVTYLFACCPAAEAERAEAVLRTMGFARPVQNTSKLPREKILSKEERMEDCRKTIQTDLEKLTALAERRREIEALADYCRMRAEGFRAIGETAATAHTVLIKGYVTERDLPRLEKALNRDFTVVIETEDANEDIAPVKLKNRPFSSPAEALVEMYSLPGSRDIDPTPITGFFYYLFFGMMFSDAGYGLLMILATTLVLKKCNPKPSMRQSMRLFRFCGISTFLWGLVYGSFFGDSIAVFSESFFGHRVALPALIDPMNGDAVLLLVISLALGLVEIIVGLCAKFATALKNGDKAGAFFDAGLWITTLLGIAVMAAGFALFAPLKTAGIVIAVASAVGLILTQGRDKKNPVARLFSGVASLYDITGYISDLLSFSRLMALGLTTSAMSAVFNMLAGMGGRSAVGFLMAILIFPVGHAINFGLNVLGAYVHTLRLQYVELFSKFYEGGGKKFKTFSLGSKYVDLSDETLKEEN